VLGTTTVLKEFLELLAAFFLGEKGYGFEKPSFTYDAKRPRGKM
jgi:hypothetical protein